MVRVALTGWFTFPDGEVTAGDVLALAAVREALDRAGLAYDVFWSPGFRPGADTLDGARPGRYSHLVFVCGPLHGAQVAGLHTRFPGAVRIAVGVSVVDAGDPAAAGFDAVLPRDAPGRPPRADLSLAAPPCEHPPVAGVILTGGQGEYGARRRHDDVSAAVRRLVAETGAAVLPLDTRLSTREWRLPSTAGQLEAVLRRTDLVVTTRLHGLVLALRLGVPALAVDPVEGGAKVTAQAGALGWPAVLRPADLAPESFGRWWDWCLAEGPPAAGLRGRPAAASLADGLVALLRAPAAGGAGPV